MESEDNSFGYETLWKFIIRPPKDDYTEKMLGKPKFKFNKKIYERKEYSIMSTQGYLLKCSFIEPSKKYRKNLIMPVVIYLHGNSSSRIEGLQMSNILLKNDINLFVFDFAGSGLSEGKYISLGYHESNDLENVINFVEKIEGVGNIGIWGRSMGAATTMIYAHKNKRIKVICLDSPFADFMRLAKEMVLSQITLPNFLIVGMLKIIGSTIYDKNGLDIEKLRPIDSAPKTFQPVFFIHAKNDKLINVNHSIDLYKKYGGKDKKIKILDRGGHNTKRNEEIIKEIGEFFRKYLVGNTANKNIKNNNKNNNEVNNNNVNVDKNKNDNNNNNNNELKKKESEEEDYPFNDKSAVGMEYMKKKEEKQTNQINRMSIFLKSIREDDIKKSIAGDIIINNDNDDDNFNIPKENIIKNIHINNNTNNKININLDHKNIHNNKDKILTKNKSNNNINYDKNMLTRNNKDKNFNNINKNYNKCITSGNIKINNINNRHIKYINNNNCINNNNDNNKHINNNINKNNNIKKIDNINNIKQNLIDIKNNNMIANNNFNSDRNYPFKNDNKHKIFNEQNKNNNKNQKNIKDIDNSVINFNNLRMGIRINNNNSNSPRI